MAVQTFRIQVPGRPTPGLWIRYVWRDYLSIQIPDHCWILCAGVDYFAKECYSSAADGEIRSGSLALWSTINILDPAPAPGPQTWFQFNSESFIPTFEKTRAEAYMWYYFYSRTWNIYNSQMWVTVIHTSHYLIVALLYPTLLCLVTTAGRVVPTQLRHDSQRAAQGLPRTTTEDRMLSMSQAKKESTSLSPPLNDYCSDILIFLILVYTPAGRAWSLCWLREK